MPAIRDAALTVSPASLANDYTGAVTLTATGLTSGQTVHVDVVRDLNANGSVNTGEPVVVSSKITDGQAPAVAGMRVPAMPGDGDGAVNGQVRVALTRPTISPLLSVTGKYLCRVRSTTGTLLASAALTVTMRGYGQTVSGTVIAGQGVPGACVQLASADRTIAIGTLSGTNGSFSISAPPGRYSLQAYKVGYMTPAVREITVIEVNR
jgi:hypothetical protein